MIWRVEFDETGTPEALHWREAELAPPAEGEVTITVKAASVNPIDAKIRAGRLPPLPLSFPATSGRDGMGVITALGQGVPAHHLGQRVAFLAPRGAVGTWATALNLPVAIVSNVPEAVPDLTAAALPLAGLSALAVVNLTEPAGKSLLVHGGAGGVGRLAIQLARLQGANVQATASARNHAALQSLGASKVWSYDEGPPPLKGLDAVIDLIGGATHQASYAMLRKGGILACLNADPFTDNSAAHGIDLRMAEVAPDPAALSHLLDLVAQGKLNAAPTQFLPIQDFAKAHRLIEEGAVSGKLVLDFT